MGKQNVFIGRVGTYHRFCLLMERRSHIGLNPKSFKNNNWLPVKKRVNQCIAVTAYHCKNNLTLLYV